MISITAERFGELLAAEARLAAVKALCDQRHAEHGNRVLYGGTPAPAWLTTDEVLAAARGEGDR